MEFRDYLKVNAQKIETELDKILVEFLKETKKIDIKLFPFAKRFKNACMGGKRIRGVLCKLGYEIAGGLAEEIYKVGAALEILHTGILIHDDIIDQSPTRRNQPSVYQALGGDHYGISQAITLGDIGLYLAFKIIAKTDFPSESKIKILEYLSQTIIKTGFGQLLDVEFSLEKNAKEKDLRLLYTLKTANYTIAGPFILGAILGGGDEQLIRALGEFGENLGIAFQIQDDILDSDSPLNYTKKEALEYTKKANKIIPKISSDDKIKQLLEGMTEYMVERKF